MNLRPYQRECVHAIGDGWDSFSRQLIVVPTGGGKTIIFSAVAKANPGRTLILAHREELIDQAIHKLEASTGLRAEKEKADDYASRSAQVVVGSVQSLTRQKRLNRWPNDHFSLVIVDEAHHAISASFLRVLHHFDTFANVLGVTATPDRGDKRNLGTYFERVAYEVRLFDLINDGYLSRIVTKAIPLRIDLNKVETRGGDFADEQLGEALEPYLGQIASVIAGEAGLRRTLAFLPLRATSQKFVDACRSAGLRAEHIDGTSPDRRQILDRFARGEFDVLSNAMLLTEGYDDPGIDCVCVLRPTRSRPLYCQMVGRGTRIAEGKDNLLLLDFLWMHERHAISRPANLVAESQDLADAITGIAQDKAKGGEQELDLEVIAGEATAQREEALRKKLEEQRKKERKTISAEEFALQHHNTALAEYEPEFPWERLPATPKQVAALKRASIDPATVHGKGHAAKLIGLLHEKAAVTLATPAQRALMQRLGFDGASMATADQARKFFATMKRR